MSLDDRLASLEAQLAAVRSQLEQEQQARQTLEQRFGQMLGRLAQRSVVLLCTGAAGLGIGIVPVSALADGQAQRAPVAIPSPTPARAVSSGQAPRSPRLVPEVPRCVWRAPVGLYLETAVLTRR